MSASTPYTRPGTRHARPEEQVLYALQFLPEDQAADLRTTSSTATSACTNSLSSRAIWPPAPSPATALAPGARPPAPKNAGRPREPLGPPARARGLWTQRPFSLRPKTPPRSAALRSPSWAGLDGVAAGLAVAGANSLIRRGPARQLSAQSTNCPGSTPTPPAHPLLDALTIPTPCASRSPPSRQPNPSPSPASPTTPPTAASSSWRTTSTRSRRAKSMSYGCARRRTQPHRRRDLPPRQPRQRQRHPARPAHRASRHGIRRHHRRRRRHRSPPCRSSWPETRGMLPTNIRGGCVAFSQ